jgi:uroporphyrinogen decarboxylase
MNARERAHAAMEFRPVDHVSIMPLVMRFAARLAGVPYSSYLQDPRVLVAAQIECQRRFGYDYVTVCSDGYREAEACGAVLSFPEDSTPAVERHAIESSDDLKRKVVPDPETAARMKDRIESIRLFKEQTRGEVSILGWVEGPFAAAAAMCGLESLLINLHVDQGFVRDVLEYALAVEIAFARAQAAAGADFIGVGDAATSLISPAHYRALALPYEKRLFAAIRETGAKSKLHICGNTSHILDDMAAAGADCVNVDWMVDLGAARRAFGTKVALKGNMDPVAAVLHGTPASIAQMVRADIATAAVDGKTGYIIGLGCEVTPETPEKNLQAFVEAARAV